MINNTDYNNFDILVVDNGSNDGSVLMIEEEYPEIQIIINEENRGFSKGNNQGFEYAVKEGFDYVLSINNDSKITDGDWLTKLVEVAEVDSKIGVVSCKSKEPDGTIHYDGRHFPLDENLFPKASDNYSYNKFHGQEINNQYQYIDQVICPLLIDTDVVQDIGGFDEAYTPIYWEDSDFSARVWDSGSRIGYISSVSIDHIRQKSSEKLDANWRRYIDIRNHVRFIGTNYPISWILNEPLWFPKLLVSFFLKYDGGDLVLRETFTNNPLDAFLSFTKTLIYIIAITPDIVTDRRDRCDIKTLLK